MPERELRPVDMEQTTIAIYSLLDDVIRPMFQGSRLDRLLAEISKEEKCSREQAALYWMEDHFDSLYAAVYAASALAEVIAP